jgi:uncharacterized protein YqeY
MGLRENIAQDLKEAMRAGDALRRDVLRGVLTAISRAEIPGAEVEDQGAGRRTLDETELLAVIDKQAKQRRDSIDAFRKAGRTDLAEREEKELAILAAYLPRQLSREEVIAEVSRLIAEVGARGPGDKSKVMPIAIARLKGRADGRTVNEVVTELLSG